MYKRQIYGGVVPEIASRKHVEAVSGLAREALERAGLSREEVDGVAVTYAPVSYTHLQHHTDGGAVGLSKDHISHASRSSLCRRTRPPRLS